MTTQIALRLDGDLVVELDALLAKHPEAATRSKAIRLAIEELVKRWRNEEIDRQIVEGYTRIPAGTVDEWGDMDAMSEWAWRINAKALDDDDGGW